MAKTKYSHAFLVGLFNGKRSKLKNLVNSGWTRECVTQDGNIYKTDDDDNPRKRYAEDQGYNGLCSVYYKAHIDAMLEEGDKYGNPLTGNKPNFLKDVSHYFKEVNNKITLCYIEDLTDSNGKTLDHYSLVIQRLHLYFFPLDTVFFAIEIDDTGSELNDLTMGHFLLSTWAWEGCTRFTDSTKDDLKNALSPLLSLLNGNDPLELLESGNKLKIFQTIQVSAEEVDDALLYEIATSSPIGCVNNPDRFISPSQEYVENIIKNNGVSAFKKWKGLALVDSFTILGTVNGFRKNDCNYMYFPLIYLRCLFEKTFCFTRNIAYRENKAKKKLYSETMQMEQYYFYENISYNFLPNMLYKAMAKSLDIESEREGLSRQIKERHKKRNNQLLSAISVFAIFSVIFDLYSLVKAWATDTTLIPTENNAFNFCPALLSNSYDNGELPLFSLILFVIALSLSVLSIWYLNSKRR